MQIAIHFAIVKKVREIKMFALPIVIILGNIHILRCLAKGDPHTAFFTTCAMIVVTLFIPKLIKEEDDKDG